MGIFQVQNKQDDFNNDEEIDVKAILNLFIRKRLLLVSIAGISCIIGVIYALSIERTWKGLIQIVISSKNQSSLLSQTNAGAYTGIAQLLSGENSDISTQVNILQSPSVLLPVFEYYKSEKRKDGLEVDNLKFHHWQKDNLEVELTRGTSIVNFYYIDTNKKRILNVLEKVSSTYQNYEGLKRNKNLENALIYLENQVKIYKEKSINSLRKASEYAIQNELFLEPNKNLNSSGMISNSSMVESERVKKINEIKTIKQKIEKLNSSSISSEEIIGFAEENKENNEILNKLNLIDEKLSKFRSIYKENDQEFIKLTKERDELIKFINKRLIGSLKTKKFLAEASVISSKRPKEKLLKYEELTTEAKIDNLNLTSLQNELRLISLEKARESKPWEVITKPTVFDTPEGPARKKIVFITLMLGSFIGGISAILLERFGSIIYKQFDLKPYLHYPILLTVPTKNEYEFLQKISIFSDLDSSEKFGNLKGKVINLFHIGFIDKNITAKLKSQLSLNLLQKEINIKEIIDLKKNDDINIAISCYGKLTKNEIIEFNKIALSKKISIYGIIMFS